MNAGWQLSNRVTEQESGSGSSPSCSSVRSGDGEEGRGLRHGVAEAEDTVVQRSAKKKGMRLRGRRGGRRR
uniref:PHT2 n=1 Tax=Arundo donax TaxID=35708 RepID=A0A0A9D8I1_ARUDO